MWFLSSLRPTHSPSERGRGSSAGWGHQSYPLFGDFFHFLTWRVVTVSCYHTHCFIHWVHQNIAGTTVSADPEKWFWGSLSRVWNQKKAEDHHQFNITANNCCFTLSCYQDSRRDRRAWHQNLPSSRCWVRWRWRFQRADEDPQGTDFIICARFQPWKKVSFCLLPTQIAMGDLNKTQFLSQCFLWINLWDGMCGYKQMHQNKHWVKVQCVTRCRPQKQRGKPSDSPFQQILIFCKNSKFICHKCRICWFSWLVS